MKMLKREQKMVDWFKENYLTVGFILVTVLAYYVRRYMLDFETNDYINWLSKWFDYLKENGGLAALGTYPGDCDYNPPYLIIMALLTYLPFNKLHLIKAVSIIFDYALALSSASLVAYLVKDKKGVYYFFTYAIMLFVPEVVMNGALWGQCDSIYATFVVLSILFLVKEKYHLSFILLGVAFAFKLQFIFILPLYIIIYFMRKKFSILYFLYLPVVNLVLSLPAIIAGRPIIKILTIYAKQIGEYADSTALNFLNSYILFGENSIKFTSYGIIVTVLVCFLMLMYVIYKKVEFNNQKILNLGLWFVVVTTFLLPRMHDRYLYLGMVMAVIYYIAYRKNLPLLICVLLCSVLTYSHYLFGVTIEVPMIITLAYVVVLVYYTKDLLHMLCEDNT